ncbi:MAG TPA: glycosyltransferase family 2 protein [Chroococcidiopsis sp.]
MSSLIDSSKPLVSVVLIFLNEQRFIQEAIDSVLAQTYPHWELLIVDDGSTDESTGIAQGYAQQYPDKIRYLEHPGHQNCGMSASRNLGIQNATGKYLAFIDADDLYTANKLERQVSILEAHPEAALVAGRTKWWYSWSGNPEDADRDLLQQYDSSLDTLLSPPDLLLCFLKNEWASLCDILVVRERVRQVGGYENLFRGMYEDQAFHAKLCLNFPVFLSSETWYLYRQHPNACTSTVHSNGKYHIARKTFLNWLKHYLIQQQSPHSSVMTVVEEALVPYNRPLLERVIGRVQRIGRQMKALVHSQNQ